MMHSWWLLWMLVMLLFLVPSVGYGWGYRRWGAPYPRYIQRRRQQAALTGSPTTFNHESWGWGGDFVWTVLLFGGLWAAYAFWWH